MTATQCLEHPFLMEQDIGRAVLPKVGSLVEGEDGLNVLIEAEAEAVPGEEEVGPMCRGDPSHEQVVRYHDQEEVAQVTQPQQKFHGDGGES